jgi:Metallo-beta-lactamase superfamily
VSSTFADRFMVGRAVVAGIVATVILLGMCGMRVNLEQQMLPVGTKSSTAPPPTVAKTFRIATFPRGEFSGYGPSRSELNIAELVRKATTRPVEINWGDVDRRSSATMTAAIALGDITITRRSSSRALVRDAGIFSNAHHGTARRKPFLASAGVSATTNRGRCGPSGTCPTAIVFENGLAAAGLTVDDIDYMMCTHLHPDHVGWNTRFCDEPTLLCVTHFPAPSTGRVRRWNDGYKFVA